MFLLDTGLMVHIEASNATTVAPFADLNVVLDSGERPPSLAKSGTRRPGRIATRRPVWLLPLTGLLLNPRSLPEQKPA